MFIEVNGRNTRIPQKKGETMNVVEALLVMLEQNRFICIWLILFVLEIEITVARQPKNLLGSIFWDKQRLSD